MATVTAGTFIVNVGSSTLVAVALIYVHSNRFRQRLSYWLAYVVGVCVSWVSLAVFLHERGEYVSVLSWNLFGLEELYRYHVNVSATRSLPSAAGIAPVVIVAGLFPAVLWLIRQARLRFVGIAMGAALLLAILVWMPNPWGNM